MVLCIIIFLSLILASGGCAATLAEQREAFLKAEQALKANHRSEFEGLLKKLTDYPLYPYLLYKNLSEHLEQTRAVEKFLTDYAATRYAPLLRAKWLQFLASEQRWWEYIRYYRESHDTPLQCHYYWALYKTGHRQEAMAGAGKLWLVGHSQPKACDALFKVWLATPALTAERVWQRFRLAMAQGQIGLARYLKRFLSEQDGQLADFWLAVHNRPEKVISCPQWKDKSPLHGLIFAHGIDRLAREDPARAAQVWKARNGLFEIERAEQAHIDRRLGLALATQRHRDALAQLAAVDPEYADEEVRAWGVRSALRQQDWSAALEWLDKLSATEKAKPSWLYWRARALEMMGAEQEALELYRQVAQDRSFYGFMAADRLELDYAFSHRPLALDGVKVSELAGRTPFQAVREFMYFDRKWEARREWWHAVKELSEEELLAAAKLAQQWRWDQMAIFTIARAEYWDDLQLRFPLAYFEPVVKQAERNQIDPAFVYGLIRRESAFDRYAASPVGARGLMQIMPSTGRIIAKLLDEKWQSVSTLYDPEVNLRYGTAYFRNLLARFDHHFVLAAAAYNAGPHRVDRWLPTGEAMPADIWIETIPFKETRQYVSTVLAYTMIYQQRMGRQTKRIQHYMRQVDASKEGERAPGRQLTLRSCR